MAKDKDLARANGKVDHKEELAIGPALGKARKRAGITQVDAAKQVPVHYMTLSEWERGLRKVPMKAVMTLLPIYGTTMDAILREIAGPPLLSENVARGTSAGRVSEPAPNTEFQYGDVSLGQQGRVRVQQLLLEFAESGADDQFLAWARRFLLNSDNYVNSVGAAAGQTSSMSDVEKLAHIERLALVPRRIIEHAAKKANKK